MAIDTRPLERAGLHLPPGEVEREVSRALADVVPPYGPPDPSLTWPEDEYAAFLRAGVPPEDVAPLSPDALPPEVRSAARLASLTATALPVAAVAERLGLDASSVRRRLAAHTLFGVMVDGAWRLPLFQFTDDGAAVVPGFAALAPLLAELHPLDVFNWFTTPHVDLVLGEEDERLSPRDWLLSGGLVEDLLPLIAELRGDG